MWTLPDALTKKGGRDGSSKKGKQGQVKAFSKSEHAVSWETKGCSWSCFSCQFTDLC